MGTAAVGILIFSTAPLYAQRQRQDRAKLKADARNVVGTIANDKAKTQADCQTHFRQRSETPKRSHISGQRAESRGAKIHWPLDFQSPLANLLQIFKPGPTS